MVSGLGLKIILRSKPNGANLSAADALLVLHCSVETSRDTAKNSRSPQ